MATSAFFRVYELCSSFYASNVAMFVFSEAPVVFDYTIERVYLQMRMRKDKKQKCRGNKTPWNEKKAMKGRAIVECEKGFVEYKRK